MTEQKLQAQQLNELHTTQTITPCTICGALVYPPRDLLHLEWHRANQLHAPDCAHLLTVIAQRSTGAYLAPRPCTCPIGQPS